MKRLLCACLLLSALPAFAELVDRVAAVVNKEIIPLSEVEARAAPELQRVKQDPDPARRNDLRKQVMKRALDSLIGEKLMEVQLKELNIDVGDAEIEASIEEVKRQNNLEGDRFEQLLVQEGYSMKSYREYLKKHIARSKLVNLKVRSKVKVSDEDLKAEYAKDSKLESEDAEVRVRHILVQIPEKATAAQVEAARLKAVALSEEARKTPDDFAEIAKKKSEGPSAADGGDLGFFRRGVMTAAFEKVAFTTPVGQIAPEPVKTSLGWHVIKVEEKRAISSKGFEEVKEQLREKLLRNQLEKYTDQYVQELRSQAVVEEKI